MLKTSKYTIDYFIQKFTAIPTKQWCVGMFRGPNNTRCALGHCGAKDASKGLYTALPPEARALVYWVEDHFPTNITTPELNDGRASSHLYGRRPRTRILNYLKELKKKQRKQEKQKHV